MEIVALPPIAASSLVWRTREGAISQTIICKVTFDLAPDRLQLSEHLEPINERDEYWNDDPRRSVYAPSDVAPVKPRADVVVVGKAYAPNKAPVRSLHARLAIGAIDKTIVVHCDRLAARDGRVYEGPPFTSMPIVYERAAGGPGTWNPVGMSRGAADGVNGDVRLPNLVPKSARGAPRMIEPVGFGPIARRWPERAKKLGPAATFPDREFWTRPLPEGLDMGFFNAAPQDQQLSSIADDEALVLEGLNRQHAALSTRLSGLAPRATFERRDGAEDVALVLDTIWIDTDRAICALTWRGAMLLSSAEEAGRVVVSLGPSASRPSTTRRGDEDPTSSIMGDGARLDAPSLPTPSMPPAPMPLPNLRGDDFAPERPPHGYYVPPREALEVLWADEAGGRTAENGVDTTDVGALSILRKGEVADEARLQHAFVTALSKEVFAAPLVTVEGAIDFAFDARATLEAAVAIVASYATGDKRLHDLVGAVGERLVAARGPYAPGLDFLYGRLCDAFGEARGERERAWLEAETTRAVVLARAFDRRVAWGGDLARATITLEQGAVLAVYFPLTFARATPACVRLRARIVAEARIAIDETDPGPCALRMIAAARLVPRA